MNNYIFPFLWMRGENEQILRTEIEKIDECGIRAICVEARPHDDFCGPGWWHDMDIVLGEAKKRGMKVWILDDKHFPTGYANGLIEKKYPERKKQYIACTTADVFGAEHPQTLNIRRMMKPTIGFWEIGNPVDYAEQARNELVSVVALRFTEGSEFAEESIDLTDACNGDLLSVSLPSGQWRIHVIYKTRTDGGNDTYINMIDAVSAHTQIEGVYEAHYERYAAEFGKTIAGFFSDEPQFGNISDQCFDTKLGKKKMPLPWSDELLEMLRARYGERLGGLLPFLFAESAEKKLEPQIRYDYMDCISRLYAKNFARPIGRWCHDHGVEYIGHVVEDNGVHSRLGLGAAHWFRAMEGQDMAGIDMIGGQYRFGAPVQQRKGMTENDGEFYHYALGKLGASGGHLDPKKKGRTMCELFGAYGWGFGVREMNYLLDHLLSKGINHLVPHAFSMAEYPDYDCPPHFYARGNNPQFPFFSELMHYANRMCDQLNGGQHVASVAVLYDGELDWPGDCMPMQKVCRVLTENQIEFDIVCLDMLQNLPAYQGIFAEGKLQINGVSFDALLIPYADYAPAGIVTLTKAAEDFPVYFIDARPKAILNGEDGEHAREEDLDSIPVLPLKDLAKRLEAAGMKKIQLKPACSQINVYHYQKDEQIFMLMNESADQSYEGTVVLPSDHSFVYYNAFADRYEEAETELGAPNRVRLLLEPGESCLLIEKGEKLVSGKRLSRKAWESCCKKQNLSEGWQVKCLTSKGETALETCFADALRPISELLPKFSGTIRYQKSFTLTEVPSKAFLRAEQVYESMRVSVNGKLVGSKLTPPYAMDLGNALHAGENTILVEIATTPARDQLNYPMPPFDFSHEGLEPTGMFGVVELLYC